MSLELPAWVALACGSGALGGAGGAGMALLVVRFADSGLASRLLRGRARPSRFGTTSRDVQETLSNSDRAEIIRDFAAHSTAMSEQVTSYADSLADGDPLLRERLRRFEQGGGRPW